MENTTTDEVLFVTFNQDHTLIAIGTEKGFRIYNSVPFKELFHRDLDGGIEIIELLYRTNIIALVGGGKTPKYASNKVVLWDERKEKEISEFRVSYHVQSVKLKKDKIFVVCEDTIYVFGFTNFENIETIDIYPNAIGIISISQNPNTNIIAFAGVTKGIACVKNYNANTLGTVDIRAHTNEIGFLYLNNEGTLLATASKKGTLIRIFKTNEGTLFQELRRGSEQAVIVSITFDPFGKNIACYSEKGTVHIFNIKKLVVDQQEIEQTTNQRSLFGKVAKMLNIQSNYLESEWSFAQFKIPPGKAICAFGPNNTIIVVSKAGKYYQAVFDPNSTGHCTKIAEKQLLSNSILNK